MKTISVGLTGLSRAGKTVFLTTAIYHLLELTGLHLHQFRVNGWRYLGRPARSRNGRPWFPYQANSAAFKKEPADWPPPTVDVTEYSIDLELFHDSGKKRECCLRFVDYPGERLLDIAHLETTYDSWSDDLYSDLSDRKLSQRAQETVRHAQEAWLASAAALQADSRGEVPEDLVRAVQRNFGRFAFAVSEAGRPIAPVGPVLKAMQAGTSDTIETPFFPLDRNTRDRLPKLHKDQDRRYRAYLKHDVEPFLKRIAACDHQIVLVDLLDILRGGNERHNEVRTQLREILHCYGLINRGRFRRLMAKIPLVGRPQIRRVTFCATKVDQVPRDCRENLIPLLRELFEQAVLGLRAHHHIRDIHFQILAAHRSTEDVQTQYQGKPIIAVRGLLNDGTVNCKKDYFTGEVPETWPENAADWQVFRERFPSFRPGKLPDRNGAKPPHLNMDAVLYEILENLL